MEETSRCARKIHSRCLVSRYAQPAAEATAIAAVAAASQRLARARIIGRASALGGGPLRFRTVLGLDRTFHRVAVDPAVELALHARLVDEGEADPLAL